VPTSTSKRAAARFSTAHLGPTRRQLQTLANICKRTGTPAPAAEKLQTRGSVSDLIDKLIQADSLCDPAATFAKMMEQA
jgi:hypothetical protein